MEFLIEVINYTSYEWILLVGSALLVGISKTSISGLLMPVIAVLALQFGGKESTAIVLFLLIIGDLFAVFFYKRDVLWADIVRLMPPTFVGLGIGVVTGELINDAVFKSILSTIVIICLILLIYNEKKGERVQISNGSAITVVSGVVSGFASMIGNSAGPIFAVYLLAMGMKKKRYLGTTAWFFLIVNVSKVPLQIFFWDNVGWDNIVLALVLIPAVTIGAFLGFFFISR
ncbi:MAG TPA: sulfite exporter TauE/SafE family protein, partial [Eubacteriaceae bacterium]|nr:sulfite exporter TauE/SafE family protein [Eubacteriaceae bacterium]